MRSRHPRILAALGVWLACIGALGPGAALQATPQYAARSGRACDNCHLTPNGWENPDLSLRKCTLSCQACHVDPSGGGMRTAPGLFFGRSTLPMVATSPRPTADWDRNLPFVGRRDRATTYDDHLPLGPRDYDAAPAYLDSTSERWAFGRPRSVRQAAPPSRFGFLPGRYGRLEADPLFRVGGDLRIATLVAGNALVFPMQVDVPVALHPFHHVTLFANTGFRGRRSGFSDTVDDRRTPYLREAFVLLHEMPYQAYVKAGRFVPSFGLRLDDHTMRTRRDFELDGSLPESRVAGIELGAAPNYPFAQVSLFGLTSLHRSPASWDITDRDAGWGWALNTGYRETGWSVGASAMVRRRPLDEGGNTESYGGYVALNPWFYSRRMPFLLQAEFDYGTYVRASGRETSRNAFYQELDWMAFNGLTWVLAYDWSDPDRQVREDESHRIQAGVQLVPIAGITLDARIRALVPTAGGADADLFVQLHLWN